MLNLTKTYRIKKRVKCQLDSSTITLSMVYFQMCISKIQKIYDILIDHLFTHNG